MKMSGSCSVLAGQHALTFSCASPQGAALYTASVPQDTEYYTEFLITLPYTEEEFDLQMQTNFVQGLASATKFDTPDYGFTKIMSIVPGPPKEYGQDRTPDTVQITARIATTRPKLEKLLEAHDFLGSDFASAANKISSALSAASISRPPVFPFKIQRWCTHDPDGANETRLDCALSAFGPDPP